MGGVIYIMSAQFSWDVFDTSPGKPAKIDNLHSPDLTMLQFAKNDTKQKIQLKCHPKIHGAIPPKLHKLFRQTHPPPLRLHLLYSLRKVTKLALIKKIYTRTRRQCHKQLLNTICSAFFL